MTPSQPQAKWQRQFSPYRIMSDLNWADLRGDGIRQILFATSDDGVVHCVNGDGSDAWQFEPGHQRFAGHISVCQPSKGSGRKLLLVVSRHRNVYALESSGRLAWVTHQHADSIFGGPTVAGPPGSQMMVYGGDRGRLFAFDQSGDLLWYFAVAGAIHSAPGVGDVDGDGALGVRVAVEDDDDVDTLAHRILEEEHRIASEAIRIVALGNYRIEGRRVLFDQ